MGVCSKKGGYMGTGIVSMQGKCRGIEILGCGLVVLGEIWHVVWVGVGR